MRRMALLIGTMALIALLASAFQLAPASAQEQLTCHRIFGPKQSSILLGKTQAVGQVSVGDVKQVMVRVSSQQTSPTRVRTELAFNDKNATKNVLYTSPGQTTVRTFSTQGAKNLSVQAYSYTQDSRKAHNNVSVAVDGCK
jgi:hypothetical protein